jgi:hypothetical protein
MPDLTNLPAAGAYSGAAIRAALRGLVDDHNRPRSVRPLEYFGGASVDWSETPSDNAAAFAAALDWCAETGGQAQLGGGIYGVDGPVTLASYANFRGCGAGTSRVTVLTQGVDLFTMPAPAAGNSRFLVSLRDFEIDGGWSPNWNTAMPGTVPAAIRLLGDADGPDDPVAYAREAVGYISDAHHVVEGLRIRNFAGDAIYADGRGEMQIKGNWIEKVQRHGLFLEAPDNWVGFNTIFTTGDSAVRLTAGNNRFVAEKYWFAGMHRAAEVVGAGLHIDGAGVANVVCAGVTTQDTWGPGLIAEGDSLIFSGNLDEAGGGRVEQQGYGWTGSRTKQRSWLRLGDMTKSRITASLGGGARTAVAPYLVDVDSSGAAGNEIDLYSEGITAQSARVRVATGNSNAKRHNVIRENGKLLRGRVTEAQLADAAHGVQSGPDVVALDPSGLAVRATDGTWRVVTGTAVTPA